MSNEQEQDVVLENNEELEINLEESQEEVEEEQPQVDWRAEALKHKAIAERLAKKKSPQLTEKKEPQTDLAERLNNLELLEKKRQFGYEHGLSPDEADAIFKINPNPSKEDLDNPFIKGGLEALRAKRRVAENTPSSSSRSVTFKGKDVKDVLLDDKIPKSDKQSAWEKMTGVKK